MCTYQTSLQQGNLQYIAAEVKLVHAVWVQLSLVIHIEVVIEGMWFLSKSCLIGRNDGVDCFNPYTGYQPWLFLIIGSPQSHFCLDVPWIMWSLCTRTSTKSSFHPASFWGMGYALCSKCTPSKTGDLNSLLNSLVLMRSDFFILVQSWNTVKISGVKWVLLTSESEIYIWSLALKEVYVWDDPWGTLGLKTVEWTTLIHVHGFFSPVTNIVWVMFLIY